jgi:Signal transduction histidine kinase
MSGNSNSCLKSFDGSSSPSALLDRPNWFALALRLNGLPVLGKAGVALGLLAIVAVVGYLYLPNRTDTALLLFFPAALFCSLFLSQASGLIALILGAVCAKLLLSSTHSWNFVDQEEMAALGFFLISGSLIIMASGTLHQAFFVMAQRNEELRTAKEKITVAEREKDLLLQELSHRFRNDLSNLTSLLRLQAAASDDPNIRSALTSAANRVYTMGRVHQRLHSIDSDSTVDLRPFAMELCEDLRATLIGSRSIDLRFQSDEIRIPLSQAVTIGLVLNELLTNAVKYAFPNSRPGTINVRITRNADRCSLVVADNGVGNNKAAQGIGLGQRLIGAMATQLGGVCSTDISQDGRTCTLEFPIKT